MGFKCIGLADFGQVGDSSGIVLKASADFQLSFGIRSEVSSFLVFEMVETVTQLIISSSVERIIE